MMGAESAHPDRCVLPTPLEAPAPSAVLTKLIKVSERSYGFADLPADCGNAVGGQAANAKEVTGVV